MPQWPFKKYIYVVKFKNFEHHMVDVDHRRNLMVGTWFRRKSMVNNDHKRKARVILSLKGFFS